MAKELDLVLEEQMKRTVNELMVEVREKRREHWEAKKVALESRSTWLEGEAMLRAEAAGEKDWAKRVKRMIFYFGVAQFFCPFLPFRSSSSTSLSWVCGTNTITAGP